MTHCLWREGERSEERLEGKGMERRWREDEKRERSEEGEREEILGFDLVKTKKKKKKKKVFPY